MAQTDVNRAVVVRNSYEPYGGAWNSTIDGTGYTGHVMDQATGLTYMQQRYYDPMVGRFLSVDPMASDQNNAWNFNRYNYAANNPYKFTDPDGRYSCEGACPDQDAAYAAMREKMRTTKSPSERSVLRKALGNIKPKGQGGPRFIAKAIPGNTAARRTDQGILYDPSKINSVGETAGRMAHEAVHEVQVDSGVALSTREDFTAVETEAWNVEAEVAGALGWDYSREEIAAGIEGSVTSDLEQARATEEVRRWEQETLEQEHDNEQ